MFTPVAADRRDCGGDRRRARAGAASSLEDLVEIYLGEWEGHGIHRAAPVATPSSSGSCAEQRWDLIPGAEPAPSSASACGAASSGRPTRAATASVAVAFTHSAVIAEFLRQITGAEPFAFLHNANGSLSRGDLSDARRQLGPALLQRNRALLRGM